MQEDNISVEFFTGPSIAPLAATLHANCFTNAWNEAAFTSALEIPGTVLEILCMSAEPIAFSLYRHIAEEAEVLTLGTLPKFRGNGYASNLLDQGMSYLREKGVSVLFLEVGSQNIAAQRLYKAKGFADCGRRENYYNHGERKEDAIVMKVSL